MNQNADKLLGRLLEVTQNDILPLTKKAVEQGSLIFGAAILKKDDLSLVVAGSNHETANPIWHGEVYTIKKFFELPADQRPHPKDCIFYSSHEPCSLCLSAITWAEFDNFYYLFSYEETRDDFEVPDDLRILKEVFHCEHGNYAKNNAYWKSYYLMDLLLELSESEQETYRREIEKLKAIYLKLSPGGFKLK